MTTYTQLQAQAKALGIKANQKAEVLTALIAQHNAINAPVNPFEQFNNEVSALAERLTQEEAIAPKVNPNPASVKMQKWALDLSKRHNQTTTAEEIAMMSFTQVRDLISELQHRPSPASPSQMLKINETIAEMQAHGAKINISAEKLNSLTGGREGTASKMIEFLMQQKAKLNIVAPASEAQINTIAEWFLCPDIAFEDYNIERKVSMPSVSPTAWRFMTPDEFKTQLQEELSRSEASKMIDQYRAVFYEWKKSRITKAQMNHIRQLDERLASIESQAEVTFAVDQDGNIIEVATANKNTYNPRAHEPLTEHQLMQLSYKEASTLIDQMKKEQSERYASISQSKDQQDLQDKVAGFDERTGVGRAKNENDARSNEFHRLSDMIYALEAVAGQESEGLHELIQEVLIDGGGNYEHAKNEIKAFMHLCINHQDASRAYKTSGTLLQIAEQTTIGTAIAQEVGNEIQAQYSEAV
jgi:hypothetical protein